MNWLPYASFAINVLMTIIIGVLVLYVRAIKAEFWTKVFEEADRRYVASRDCSLLHSAEIAKLRADISEWRVGDRHSMRNEVTVAIGQSEERTDAAVEKLREEINRIRDRM